jgi:hypothetical protein
MTSSTRGSTDDHLLSPVSTVSALVTVAVASTSASGGRSELLSARSLPGGDRYRLVDGHRLAKRGDRLPTT